MEITDSKITTFDTLADFDWSSLVDVESRTRNWFEELKAVLNVKSECANVGLTADKFNSRKTQKDQLAFWLADAVDIMEHQLGLISRFKNTVDVMKTEAIADKTKLISTQEQLLESQNDQLVQLKSVVESTVQNTVQKEIKSYSEAVGSQSDKMGPVQVQENVKKAVKWAMQEDDRSKNLIVFGLAETDKEQIDDKVADLFGELGEKTRLSASRIGATRSDTTHCRPIKCTLTSSTVVRQILSKSRQLKLMDKYKSVFICPDRSPEERTARRALIVKLKSAAADQPDYKHFIKNGKVHSEKK